jgi:hypothetical protein
MIGNGTTMPQTKFTESRNNNPTRPLVWPLRTGLMTVLTLGGLLLLFNTSCGGTIQRNRDEAMGGNAQIQAGGAGSYGGSGEHSGTHSRGGASTTLSLPGSGGTKNVDPKGAVNGCDALAPGHIGLFADQMFSRYGKRPNVVYSWTTLEQAAELRKGGPLFSRSERPDLGRGYALDSLAKLASKSGDLGKLATQLSQSIFSKARYAWTNPWATRMGWPGEQYGNQLVMIEIREDAWHAIFDGESLWVVDPNGKDVSIAEAAANPSRIATITHIHGAYDGGPRCGTFGEYLGPNPGNNPTFSGSNGYREILIGNASMITRFSLGTKEIATRLQNDIKVLETFATLLGQCPPIPFDDQWNGTVTCAWEANIDVAPDDYVHALALPNDYYQPTVENIRRIIDTLNSDSFEINPYVVEEN